MKQEHVLEKKAFIYDLPSAEPDMEGFHYNTIKGYWTMENSDQPCIESAVFAAPRTKKADVETGEDKKGE